MLRAQIRSGISHVGLALRNPEEFAIGWKDGQVNYRPTVWFALLATAIAGTFTYGMTMGLLHESSTTATSIVPTLNIPGLIEPGGIFYKGLTCTMAAGLSWAISLPALYVLNSLSGSKLTAGTTLLAALVTVSWGGLAMLASIPVNWFFTSAIPNQTFVLLVNLVVFAGVGISMTDVFRRVMLRLEPNRETSPTWWLILVGAIGTELFYCFRLFEFV